MDFALGLFGWVFGLVLGPYVVLFLVVMLCCLRFLVRRVVG